jgi:tetratricopeptide (TPR) repeat protein
MNKQQDKPRFIVMPFQPDTGQEYDGTGLALHFLLGNIMAAQILLKEFWFGWRVKKIFKDQQTLSEFFHGKKHLDNIIQLAREQEIQHWLNGKYYLDSDKLILNLTLSSFKGKTEKFTKKFIVNISDNLIAFRNEFIDWLATFSLPFEQNQLKKIMWPEKITHEGLDFLGRSMEATYMNYVDTSKNKDTIDLKFFKKAVMSSPDSYLAWDMKGWGLYKNKAYKEAEHAFLKAEKLNKYGLGALSGLMWCYIFTNNKHLATKFALAKADVRNENHDKAIAFVTSKIKNLFK